MIISLFQKILWERTQGPDIRYSRNSPERPFRVYEFYFDSRQALEKKKSSEESRTDLLG